MPFNIVVQNEEKIIYGAYQQEIIQSDTDGYELVGKKYISSFITLFYSLMELFMYLLCYHKHFLFPHNIPCAWSGLYT